MAKAKKETYDDFDVIRAIVNFSRNYPNINGKRLRALLLEAMPDLEREQIARCAKQITESWA